MTTEAGVRDMQRSIALGLALLTALPLTTGCASQSFDSACHELSVNSSGQLKGMQKSANKARFERHVVLLETGSGMASNCRSYFIDGNDYSGLPGSMYPRCLKQGLDVSNGYCLLYYVDGQRVEQLVE